MGVPGREAGDGGITLVRYRCSWYPNEKVTKGIAAFKAQHKKGEREGYEILKKRQRGKWATTLQLSEVEVYTHRFQTQASRAGKTAK